MNMSASKITCFICGLKLSSSCELKQVSFVVNAQQCLQHQVTTGPCDLLFAVHDFSTNVLLIWIITELRAENLYSETGAFLSEAV